MCVLVLVCVIYVMCDDDEVGESGIVLVLVICTCLCACISEKGVALEMSAQ